MTAARPVRDVEFASLFQAAPSVDTDKAMARACAGAIVKSIPCRSDDGATQSVRALLALALDTADIGTWEWDVASGRLDVSTQWLRSFGFTGAHEPPPTLDGWRGIVHPEDASTFDGFVTALVSGLDSRIEMRLRRPDGSYCWQRCGGRILDGRGALRRAVGVFVDISLQRETTIRKHRVDRLETVGQLAGGLAHDFNNLLMVIQGNVDLLGDRLDDHAPSAAIIREIGATVDRGAALTRRLLGFARDERAPTGAVDVDPTLSELQPLLHHALGGQVDLRHDLAAEGWSVDVDARQFENAIINLAINARDAMPQGGTLTISTRAVPTSRLDGDGGDGPYVVVAVADRGQGMSPQVQARIFEPFFTTKAEKGTGLGIPMVARFVRQAGGHIRIDSVVGSGTTVSLYLPRSTAPK